MIVFLYNTFVRRKKAIIIITIPTMNPLRALDNNLSTVLMVAAQIII